MGVEVGAGEGVLEVISKTTQGRVLERTDVAARNEEGRWTWWVCAMARTTPNL